MGNQQSASHATLKPRKNVHWKSAGRPAVPGKPEIIPVLTEDEPNAITLRWAAGAHDGGAPLLGYQVECNRLGSADWVRTAPPVVQRPELLLSGLEPPHRYQFRVAALNAVGPSDYSELSDVLTVSSDRGHHQPPIFMQHLEDVVALENDKTEFRVTFTGTPAPTIAWFKDDYEIFSSRRTAITTTESSSVLLFHQTLASDEGEIKCTATNRAGHAVTRATLHLEAAPKLRYPRQYEDGLLYEINETIFLKTTIVGKPTPTVEWRHDGQPIDVNGRVEITNTSKFSMLKIHTARRSDRGEYQIHARNCIGEDAASFLVTVTAPPDPPRRVRVARQLDKSVTLDWEPPEDDGGCRVGNYVVEYYRTGWNVWLKATASRKTTVTLFDLIEGSEYRFRVKAESPYGMSAPSAESAAVRIPGRAVDMEFLAVESRIISAELTRVEGEEPRVSPAPRRKRPQPAAPSAPEPPPTKRRASLSPPRDRDQGSNEFMLVLYPDKADSSDKAEKRKSFQLELEDALSPPPLSLSAPDLSHAGVAPPPGMTMRAAVSSTELLHERAMARFYKAVALEEEHARLKQQKQNNIPYNNSREPPKPAPEPVKPEVNRTPDIFIKTDSVENKQFKYNGRQASHDSEASDMKWTTSFDEDYTASTVSSEGDYSEEGSLEGSAGRASAGEEDTYNPRDKMATPAPPHHHDDTDLQPLKPLPLPDPNFVPKPILKRREPEPQETKPPQDNGPLPPKEKPKPESKPKKEEKMTFLKKITKMPVQKPFPFPKLLKKSEKEVKEEEKQTETETPKTKKVPDKKEKEDNISEEGRTVIDYYGSIVKEYGSLNKKPTTQLYLKTEELKVVAEKQQQEKKEKAEVKKVVKQKKVSANKSPTSNANAKSKTVNSVPKQAKTVASGKAKLEKREKDDASNQSNDSKPLRKDTEIVLKTPERATIVIPIDYEQLEAQAKVRVRGAIDYAVDVCLLILAFYLYVVKDERLAVPPLALIIYRQLEQTLATLLAAPQWLREHTPAWLKIKTS